MLSPFEIMERSWSLYKKHFKKLLVFPVILTALNYIPATSSFLQNLYKGTTSVSITQGILILLAGLLGLFITVVVSLAFVTQLRDEEQGKGGYVTALTHALKRFPQIFIASIISGALMFVAALPYAAPAAYLYFYKHDAATTLTFLAYGLPLLAPVVWLSVKLLAAPLYIVLDQVPAIEAVKKSFAIVQNRWWAAFMRNLIPQLGWALIQFLVTFVIEIIAFVILVLIAHKLTFPEPKVTAIVATTVTALLDVLFLPLTTASLLVWFEEMKK